jgi:hypothetical protein
MTFHRVSNSAIFVMALVALPAGFLLAANDHNGRGFVAAISIFGIGSLFVMLKDLNRSAVFWWALAGVVVLHIGLVFLVPWPREVYFGALATPLVIADIYLCAKLIVFLVRPERA